MSLGLRLGDDPSMRIATASERPDLLVRAWEQTRDTNPEYNKHGAVLNEYWPRLTEERAEFQFNLITQEDGILARAHSIPLHWDGSSADLPSGIDGAIKRGFEDGDANVLCALLIAVPRDLQARGLSRAAVEAMATIARLHGLTALIAPVRPNWKERYPLVEIERYAQWRRPDQLPFDPWMRVHERLGATVLKPEPRSLHIIGTVSEWEAWTNMTFPESGDYGNAFLHLTTKGGLAVADYFEMFNQSSENGSDTDLGSGGGMLVNEKDSTGKMWQLAVGAGKDANLYVVDRTNMGKFNTKTNNVYQELQGVLRNGIYSMPAAMNTSIYYGPVSSPIALYQFSNAKLRTTATAKTANSFAYPGATPSISSNGAQNAILWAAENTNPAVLHAYNAKTLVEIYNTNQAANGRDQFGAGNKYITPMIANGKVYVGTTNGVGVFGLLAGK